MLGWQEKQREKVFPDGFSLAGVIGKSAESAAWQAAGILEAMIITKNIAI